MKLFLVIFVALIAGVTSLVIGNSGCTFKLTASGGSSGPVSQSMDGQNRVGAPSPPAAGYTMGADGRIFDQNGRGCIIMPSTTQLQCDAGAGPTTGFSIGCDGTLSYNGKSHFVACPTDANDHNIYMSAGFGQTGCVDISLNADSCHLGCISSPTLSPSPPSPPVARKTCPADLSGTYEFPHLIVPVSSRNPDTAYGQSYNAQVSKSDIQTLFNFDIPTSYSGKTCSLVFLFPRQDQLRTSAFMISGDGKVEFAFRRGVTNQGTTFNNAPEVANNYGVLSLSPGNSYTLATFDCPAGTTQTYSMTAAGTEFLYFQDYNPHP